MRGIRAYGTYLPHHRLDRSRITQMLGSGGGRGTRTVAGFDEDTTTMGVEAARIALADDPAVDALWFATAEPAYLEKTNACAIHAALRLGSSVAAMDTGGAVRSGVGALRAAAAGRGSTLVVTSGIRTGMPSGADEAAGGDAAAAFVFGDDTDGPVAAHYLGGASATAEFVDRWRLPSDATTRTWEERFAETQYVPLVQQAWADALATTGLATGDLAAVALTGSHARAVKAASRRLGEVPLIDDLAASVGNSGAAHPGLLLADLLDRAEPGQAVALVMLADGVEVVLFRATEALPDVRPSLSVATQVGGGGPITYPRFLQWRNMLTVQPPNRPAPARVSSSAAARNTDWKYGFVASQGSESGLVHLPPSRVSVDPADAPDAMVPVPMADATGTIVTFTIDRLVYSLSPPVVFAVIDFDSGGRLAMELTDIDAADVRIGARVELTFRRLSTADGIHNYFWKARPVRGTDSSNEDR